MTLGLPIWLYFPLGFVLLIAGADRLVAGAAKLAASFGVPALVVGLTVVAFGTSAPELAVSIKAGLANNGGIALGNVLGSNIANVLLILGASALVTPLVAKSQLVRVDVPIMIVCAAGLWLLCLDGVVSRLDGLVLTLGLFAYVGLLVVLVRRQKKKAGESALPAGVDDVAVAPRDRTAAGRLVNLALMLLGLGLLVVGADWLVAGATRVAVAWGVSDLVIGLTVVAVGTSLPEFATSLLAGVRGQRDLAVGNIVGSNIFNVLCVVGISAFVTPDDFTVPAAALRFDFPVMVAACVVTLPIFFTGGRVSRLEGAVLLLYFALYTTYLLLDAAGHDYVGTFSTVMVAFVLPLTLLGLLGSVAVAVRRRGVKGV